jgi:hypothetical protein
MTNNHININEMKEFIKKETKDLDYKSFNDTDLEEIVLTTLEYLDDESYDIYQSLEMALFNFQTENHPFK